MGKSIRRLLITLIFIVGMVSFNFADTPPDPGGDPGTSGGTPVGGSPIGGGLIIMLTLAIAYGTKKVYHFWNKE